MILFVESKDVIRYGCTKAVILAVCRKNRNLTLKKIEEILGLSEFCIRKHLLDLRADKKIKFYRNRDLPHRECSGSGTYNRIVRIDVNDD